MFVPEDLLIQILLRLPPKSLVRFKCVSKAWQTMIDGRQFMRQYLHLTYTDSFSSNTSLHLIFQKTAHFPTGLISLLACESDEEEESHEQLINLEGKGAPGINEVSGELFDPKINLSYNHSVSGPINGIYCINIIQHKLYDVEPQVSIVRVAFWNPGMGQFHVLPPTPRPAKLDDVSIDLQGVDYYTDVRHLKYFQYGFVFDPVSQDYKYVFISRYGNQHRGWGSPDNFHLYSLASNSWQELHHSQIAYPPDVIEVYNNGEFSFSPDIVMGADSPAFPFNRSCHWIYYDRDGIGFVSKVLSFDIVEHVFRVSVIPGTLLGEAVVNYVKLIKTVDGCLAVASPSEGYVSSVIGIIVMKEYGVDESWFRAYNIVLNSPGRFIGSFEGQLFVQKTDGWVASYRLGVGAHQEDCNEYCHVPFDNFEMLPFEGSLIPIRTVH